MRTGLSTILQTLTPEAASALNHSIAEATRRNHGQTTPLHVAATLLASPSGYLRQACIRSHPNSSHPLQCRALELCFTVALERLPTSQNLSPGLEPPISNALMAALKRAQAHQRRGCPEQQQQPLLAVKVEFEQLIVSILDDPSVSRVMREASFSSPAVKATIEQSLNSSNSVNSSSISCGLGFRPASTANRNLYLNPRLQQGNSVQLGQQRNDEVKRVADILLREKKRNPILVGDSKPEAVVKELLQRIEKRDVGEGVFRNVQVISLEKEFAFDRTGIPNKLKELGDLVESRIKSSGGGGGGVILDLGDLKWLVEQPLGLGVSGSGPMHQQIISETGAAAVAEMGKLLARFREGSGRLWLIGTATCETYLRCQVYHPSMENDWDLQAMPIAALAPLPGLFPPRIGSNGILSRSVESLTPLKSFPTAANTISICPSGNMDPAQRINFCPQCMENYEQELAKLVGKEFEKSSEVKPEAARPPLPQWLQNAKPSIGSVKATDQSQTKDQELIWKQKTQELQRKWNDTCSRIHPNFRQNLSSERIAPTALSMPFLYNSNMLGHQTFQPKLQLSRNNVTTLPMNQSSALYQPSERAITPPGSPVRTDLVLGRPKITETSPEKIFTQRIKEFSGCIPSEAQDKFSELQREKFFSPLEADSFKRLLKGLMEKVWWQKEAASALATTVTQCKSGNGKQRGLGLKGDTWLLFTGPDRVGKKKMASVLSELVCGANPITIHLGSWCDNGNESDVNSRGQTALDRIAEAVGRNPFSVVVLHDIDQADMLVLGSLKRAMERGRLADSHGREVSLGNVIFILTTDWLPENLKSLSNCLPHHEEKLATIARGGWQLQLLVGGNTSKRRPDWFPDEIRLTKPRKEAGPDLSIDLNQAAGAEDDGSGNSSDLTVEHERENGLLNRQSSATPLSRQLLNSVDAAIIFKPVDFGAIRSKITGTISSRFSAIMGDGSSIEVDDESVEKILGGVWFGQTGLEEWAEKVLVPSFHQLKASLQGSIASATPAEGGITVRLISGRDQSERRAGEDWMPCKITVAGEGL